MGQVDRSMSICVDERSLPTVEIPKIIQPFLYSSAYFMEGERVYVFSTNRQGESYPHIQVLLDTGLLVSGEWLYLDQGTDFTEYTKRMNYRYLGTGIIHKRDFI